MSKSNSDERTYIVVVCPICGTRLDERVSDKSRTAECPDCFTQVPVPARADVPQKPAPKPLPDVGVYRFVSPDGSSSPQEIKSAAKRQARRERASVLVVCPLCAARIDVLAKKEARAVKCPDCYELVRIPSFSEVEAKRQQQPANRQLPQVEALPVPTPQPMSQSVPTFFADALASIRREEQSAPPKWIFFSGVFGLPWHAEVISRWAYLTFGLTVMNVLIAFLLSMGAETAGSQFGMVVAFFVLPLIWISAWTLSYAAACCRAILEDTAAGNDRIVSWHEQDWREWILVLTWVGFLAGLSLILGHLAGRLAEMLGGLYLPTLLAASGICFPIILLSALEANAAFVPLTLPILLSLWQHLRGWLTFYVVSAMTLSVPVLPFMVVESASDLWLPAVVTAPLLAAALFMYARLLGRLGWLISRDMS